MGVPQIEDIISASAINVRKQFDLVSDKVLPFFKSTAEGIIKHHDALDAL